jgi:hypothetical protein
MRRRLRLEGGSLRNLATVERQPMSFSKPPQQPDATISRSHAIPNTSGYFPVVRGGSNESFGTEVSLAGGSCPFEVHVWSSEEECCAVYEVWTEHTVYEFDQSLRCTSVRDARTGRPKAASHPSVGARLIGGRQTHEETVDISSPLPAVGHHALLTDREQAMTVTSPVTRVVMNISRYSSRSRSIRPAVG